MLKPKSQRQHRQSLFASHAAAGKPMGVAEVRWTVEKVAVVAQFAGTTQAQENAVGENRNDTKMCTVQFHE